MGTSLVVTNPLSIGTPHSTRSDGVSWFGTWMGVTNPAMRSQLPLDLTVLHGSEVGYGDQSSDESPTSYEN
jgi:hypothetical protein